MQSLTLKAAAFYLKPLWIKSLACPRSEITSEIINHISICHSPLEGILTAIGSHYQRTVKAETDLDE
jgi:hypothetical protein